MRLSPYALLQSASQTHAVDLDPCGPAQEGLLLPIHFDLLFSRAGQCLWLHVDQGVEVAPGDRNMWWSVAEDGDVRQFDTRVRFRPAPLGVPAPLKNVPACFVCCAAFVSRLFPCLLTPPEPLWQAC